MKRNLLLLAALLGGTLLVLIVVVNALAVSAEELLPPDPAMLVQLPDGSERSLGELIAPWQDGDTLPEPPPAPRADGDAGLLDTLDRNERGGLTEQELDALAAVQVQELLERARQPPTGDDPFDLAEWHRREGRLDQARALYLALPEQHPHWGQARRRVAWDCFAVAQGEPARGVPYAHEALLDNPFDGNAWQDAVRVYAATLGLTVD
ncbi:MAG: hypothetical protein DRQ55_04970 [Planctomycetota bacterium]|nr:MAG: hypothetical protein DRQ55_04970 [Planctomycetota bacterium]